MHLMQKFVIAVTDSAFLFFEFFYMFCNLKSSHKMDKIEWIQILYLNMNKLHALAKFGPSLTQGLV